MDRKKLGEAIDELCNIKEQAEALCRAATDAWRWLVRNSKFLEPLPLTLFENLMRALDMPVPSEYWHQKVFEKVRALDQSVYDFMGVWQSMIFSFDTDGNIILVWDKDDHLSTAEQELKCPGVREKLARAVWDTCKDLARSSRPVISWPDQLCTYPLPP